MQQSHKGLLYCDASHPRRECETAASAPADGWSAGPDGRMVETPAGRREGLWDFWLRGLVNRAHAPGPDFTLTLS
jgi:hypothetical protein